MRFLTATAAICCLCYGSLADAADACSDPQDQGTMNECAGKSLKAADDRLNADFRKIEKRLADNPQAKELLVKSQRAWIAFRDAECTFQTSGSSGGSIYPMVYAQCLESMTNTRIDDFKTYLNCGEFDPSCPVPTP